MEQSLCGNENFLSLIMSGRAKYHEIDDYIDRWHDNPSGRSLHDYLGMDPNEYRLWLVCPDMLPLIIAGRNLDRRMASLAADNLQEL